METAGEACSNKTPLLTKLRFRHRVFLKVLWLGFVVGTVLGNMLGGGGVASTLDHDPKP